MRKANVDGFSAARPARRSQKPNKPLPQTDSDPFSSLPPLDPPDAPKAKPRRSKPRRFLKIILLLLLVIVIATGGYFAYKLLSTSSKLFSGNPLAILQEGKPLRTDSYGRSNILLFGTSEDDPGHPGPELSDSIMLASVDQKKHEAFLVSIPRDLNVKYDQSCTEGYRGKINVVYQCAKALAKGDEAAAQEAMRKKIGEVLGLDVQYSVHVNYSALKQMVDAVGGITVVIESDNPKGIYERYVKLPNGPAQLNGEAALALARARNAEGGYGLARSNFDREQYQQKILVALRDKAASAGTLANPIAINGLLEAASNNVRTNFETNEIRTLATIAEKTPAANIKRLDLNADESRILKGDGNPVAGDYNYKDLQAFIKAYASGNTYALEKAVIAVLNASGTPGLAQQKADELAQANIEIAAVANAPASFAASGVKLYDQSEGKKPETLKKLESTLGSKAEPMPAGLSSTADFVIVVGKQ